MIADQNPKAPAPASAPGPKKPYQTPVVTVFGSVEEITRVFLFYSKP